VTCTLSLPKALGSFHSAVSHCSGARRKTYRYVEHFGSISVDLSQLLPLYCFLNVPVGIRLGKLGLPHGTVFHVQGCGCRDDACAVESHQQG